MRLSGTFLVCLVLSATTLTRSRTDAVKHNAACSTPTDVCFLIDVSESIAPSDFELQKQFVSDQVLLLGDPNRTVRTSIIPYNSHVKATIGLQPYKSPSHVAQLISEIPSNIESTDLAMAFRRMARVFREEGRRSTRKIVVLFSGGRLKDFESAKQGALMARHIGVNLITVGLGEEANMNQLNTLAKNPNLTFHGKDMKDTAQLKETLTNIICPNCNLKTDVIFMLDGSEGIPSTVFENQKRFLQEMMALVSKEHPKIRIGIILYSSTIKATVGLMPPKTFEQLVAITRSLTQPQEGANFVSAFREMRRIFEEEGRARSNRVGVVITEGRSKNFTAATEESRLAKTAGVKMIGIGIGEQVKKFELEEYASKVDMVFFLKGFKDLSKIKETVQNLLCSDNTNTTESSGFDWGQPWSANLPIVQWSSPKNHLLPMNSPTSHQQLGQRDIQTSHPSTEPSMTVDPFTNNAPGSTDHQSTTQNLLVVEGTQAGLRPSEDRSVNTAKQSQNKSDNKPVLVQLPAVIEVPSRHFFTGSVGKLPRGKVMAGTNLFHPRAMSPLAELFTESANANLNLHPNPSEPAQLHMNETRGFRNMEAKGQNWTASLKLGEAESGGTNSPINIRLSDKNGLQENVSLNKQRIPLEKGMLYSFRFSTGYLGNLAKVEIFLSASQNPCHLETFQLNNVDTAQSYEFRIGRFFTKETFNVPQEKVKLWKIQIKVGASKEAGSRGVISVRLQGSRGTSDIIQLRSPHHQEFIPGETVDFYLSTKDIGHFEWAQLLVGQWDLMYLESLLITDIDDAMNYTFSYSGFVMNETFYANKQNINKCEKFSCADRCLPFSYVCDGLVDCPNSEDEKICPKKSNDHVPLRLTGGSTQTEGRVELFVNGLWGGVCSRNWDNNDARVVCRMMGYKNGRAMSTFPAGTDLIWMDGVRCTGQETTIMQCDRAKSHSCEAKNAAGVSCYDMESNIKFGDHALGELKIDSSGRLAPIAGEIAHTESTFMGPHVTRTKSGKPWSFDLVRETNVILDNNRPENVKEALPAINNGFIDQAVSELNTNLPQTGELPYTTEIPSTFMSSQVTSEQSVGPQSITLGSETTMLLNQDTTENMKQALPAINNGFIDQAVSELNTNFPQTGELHHTTEIPSTFMSSQVTSEQSVGPQSVTLGRETTMLLNQDTTENMKQVLPAKENGFIDQAVREHNTNSQQRGELPHTTEIPSSFMLSEVTSEQSVSPESVTLGSETTMLLNQYTTENMKQDLQATEKGFRDQAVIELNMNSPQSSSQQTGELSHTTEAPSTFMSSEVTSEQSVAPQSVTLGRETTVLLNQDTTENMKQALPAINNGFLDQAVSELNTNFPQTGELHHTVEVPSTFMSSQVTSEQSVGPQSVTFGRETTMLLNQDTTENMKQALPAINNGFIDQAVSELNTNFPQTGELHHTAEVPSTFMSSQVTSEQSVAPQSITFGRETTMLLNQYTTENMKQALPAINNGFIDQAVSELNTNFPQTGELHHTAEVPSTFMSSQVTSEQSVGPQSVTFGRETTMLLNQDTTENMKQALPAINNGFIDQAVSELNTNFPQTGELHHTAEVPSTFMSSQVTSEQSVGPQSVTFGRETTMLLNQDTTENMKQALPAINNGFIDQTVSELNTNFPQTGELPHTAEFPSTFMSSQVTNEQSVAPQSITLGSETTMLLNQDTTENMKQDLQTTENDFIDQAVIELDMNSPQSSSPQSGELPHTTEVPSTFMSSEVTSEQSVAPQSVTLGRETTVLLNQDTTENMKQDLRSTENSFSDHTVDAFNPNSPHPLAPQTRELPRPSAVLPAFISSHVTSEQSTASRPFALEMETTVSLNKDSTEKMKDLHPIENSFREQMLNMKTPQSLAPQAGEATLIVEGVSTLDSSHMISEQSVTPQPFDLAKETTVALSNSSTENMKQDAQSTGKDFGDQVVSLPGTNSPQNLAPQAGESTPMAEAVSTLDSSHMNSEQSVPPQLFVLGRETTVTLGNSSTENMQRVSPSDATAENSLADIKVKATKSTSTPSPTTMTDITSKPTASTTSESTMTTTTATMPTTPPATTTTTRKTTTTTTSKSATLKTTKEKLTFESKQMVPVLSSSSHQNSDVLKDKPKVSYSSRNTQPEYAEPDDDLWESVLGEAHHDFLGVVPTTRRSPFFDLAARKLQINSGSVVKSNTAHIWEPVRTTSMHSGERREPKSIMLVREKTKAESRPKTITHSNKNAHSHIRSHSSKVLPTERSFSDTVVPIADIILGIPSAGNSQTKETRVGLKSPLQNGHRSNRPVISHSNKNTHNPTRSYSSKVSPAERSSSDTVVPTADIILDIPSAGNSQTKETRVGLKSPLQNGHRSNRPVISHSNKNTHNPTRSYSSKVSPAERSSSDTVVPTADIILAIPSAGNSQTKVTRVGLKSPLQNGHRSNRPVISHSNKNTYNPTRSYSSKVSPAERSSSDTIVPTADIILDIPSAGNSQTKETRVGLKSTSQNSHRLNRPVITHSNKNTYNPTRSYSSKVSPTERSSSDTVFPIGDIILPIPSAGNSQTKETRVGLKSTSQNGQRTNVNKLAVKFPHRNIAGHYSSHVTKVSTRPTSNVHTPFKIESVSNLKYPRPAEIDIRSGGRVFSEGIPPQINRGPNGQKSRISSANHVVNERMNTVFTSRKSIRVDQAAGEHWHQAASLTHLNQNSKTDHTRWEQHTSHISPGIKVPKSGSARLSSLKEDFGMDHLRLVPTIKSTANNRLSPGRSFRRGKAHDSNNNNNNNNNNNRRILTTHSASKKQNVDRANPGPNDATVQRPTRFNPHSNQILRQKKAEQKSFDPTSIKELSGSVNSLRLEESESGLEISKSNNLHELGVINFRPSLFQVTTVKPTPTAIFEKVEGCHLTPYEQDERYYLEEVLGFTYVIRPCPIGTVFRRRICTCTAPENGLRESSLKCNIEFQLDFEHDLKDSSGKNLFSSSENVHLEHSAGRFVGNSYISVWRFQEAEFGDQISIRLNFKQDGSRPEVQQLVGNCVPGSKPSVSISIDKQREMVIYSIMTYSNTKTIEAPYSSNDWNEVALAYDGKVMQGITNGLQKFKYLEGKIQKRGNPLKFGFCETAHGFQGLLDSVQIYMCVPGREAAAT